MLKQSLTIFLVCRRIIQHEIGAIALSLREEHGYVWLTRTVTVPNELENSKHLSTKARVNQYISATSLLPAAVEKHNVLPLSVVWSPIVGGDNQHWCKSKATHDVVRPLIRLFVKKISSWLSGIPDEPSNAQFQKHGWALYHPQSRVNNKKDIFRKWFTLMHRSK